MATVDALLIFNAKYATIKHSSNSLINFISKFSSCDHLQNTAPILLLFPRGTEIVEKLFHWINCWFNVTDSPVQATCVQIEMFFSSRSNSFKWAFFVQEGESFSAELWMNGFGWKLKLKKKKIGSNSFVKLTSYKALLFSVVQVQ